VFQDFLPAVHNLHRRHLEATLFLCTKIVKAVGLFEC
jgi:hypothetical protein